ncbi:MAG: hypothetical protein O2800_02730 [Planctomycetota bacterium]|nr:hypothetical protein [Planctomycetota bacterium]
MGTGMAHGTGSLDASEKVLTTIYTMYCLIQKKCVPSRQTMTVDSPTQSTLRMYGPSSATGKDYLQMEIVYTRDAKGSS